MTQEEIARPVPAPAEIARQVDELVNNTPPEVIEHMMKRLEERHVRPAPKSPGLSDEEIHTVIRTQVPPIQSERAKKLAELFAQDGPTARPHDRVTICDYLLAIAAVARAKAERYKDGQYKPLVEALEADHELDNHIIEHDPCPVACVLRLGLWHTARIKRIEALLGVGVEPARANATRLREAGGAAMNKSLWEVRLEMVEHYTVEVEASPNASREEVMALALDGDNRGDEYDHELQKETALSATRLREAGAE